MQLVLIFALCEIASAATATTIGELDYGLGEGWDYTAFVYTVAGNTGLVIEMPDHVYAQIPGCSPVGIESETWGGVKALFR